MFVSLLFFQALQTPHGADVSNYSGNVTYSQWVAAQDPAIWHWKDGSTGLAYAITSGLQGRSELNLFAAEQMATARAAGVATAGYCLVSNERPGGEQVRDGLKVFGEDAKHLAFMAIDVEDPAIDPADHKIHPELIASAIEAVKAAHIKPVIYTSRRIWKLTPWMDKNPYNDVGLWDADYDDKDDLNASRTHLFVPYAGWTTRFAKQYNDESHGDGLKFVNATKIIGADVNIFGSPFSHPKPIDLPCLYVVDSNTYIGDHWRAGPNVVAGTPAQIKIDLAGVSQPAKGTIRLRSDNPYLLQLPRSIPATQTDLAIQTRAVTAPTIVTLSATYRGQTASAVFRLTPTAPH